MPTDQINAGLMALVKEGRIHPDIMLPKISAMQEIYLQANTHLYSGDDLEQIRQFLQAIAHKFRLSNMSLEQLWSASMNSRSKPYDALPTLIDRLDVEEDELLLISFALESFLLISRSFLDFYMK